MMIIDTWIIAHMSIILVVDLDFLTRKTKVASVEKPRHLRNNV